MAAPEARVVSSGLGPRFENAKRLLAKRIDEACEALKPYGEYWDDIESMVIDGLNKRGQSAD